MQGLSFRASRPGDEAAVRELVFGVLAEFGLEPDPSGTDADLDDLHAHYVEPGGMFDVLVDPAGAVVGSVGLAPVHPDAAGKVLELRKMYLHPAARGQGWGRAALERALNFARAHGVQRLELETHSVLRDAIAMYRRYGFVDDEAAPAGERCDGTMVLVL